MMRFLLLVLISINLSAQTVYKTPSGSKYHLSSCRMVKNVSSSLSLNQALQSGLTSCGICRPSVRQTFGIISKPKKLPELILKINATDKRKKDYVVKELPESEITSVSSIYQNKKKPAHQIKMSRFNFELFRFPFQ